MQRDPKTYLYDIREAGNRLERFIADKGFEDYLKDDLLRSAVERQFEIIGEALGQLGKAAPDQLKKISDAGKVIAFRNILIHGYAVVDDRVVWDIIQTKLPTLRKEVSILLKI